MKVTLYWVVRSPGAVCLSFLSLLEFLKCLSNLLFKLNIWFSGCVVKWNRDWDKMELKILEITLSLKELTGTTLGTVSCL